MALFDPVAERQRRRSREGYIQYLLACLILGRRPDGWNKPVRPSTRGARLLEAVDATAFGSAGVGAAAAFTWEFILTGRGGGELNAWPDLASQWDHRLLLFELKTEPGSHREGQVDWYLDLGLHHHGGKGRQVDLIYLTRDEVAGSPADLPENARYANLTWMAVNELLRTWADEVANPEERAFAEFLIEFVEAELNEGRTMIELGPPPPRATRRTALREVASTTTSSGQPLSPGSSEAIAEAERVAWEVEESQRPQALNVRLESWEQAHEFKEDVLAALEGNPPPHATPWCWRTKSLGQPQSDAGRATGFELRFSWHK